MSAPNFQTPDSNVRRDATGRRKTKVLIVDDEPAIREVLEMILHEWGYEAGSTSDGAEAKQLVESYDPEIVISDVVMPQLSGLDLLRALKAGNPNRPVILVTAHASIDLAVESMKQGAQDFITKPMDYPTPRNFEGGGIRYSNAAIYEEAQLPTGARIGFRRIHRHQPSHA